MMEELANDKNNSVNIHVSPRALSIAKMVDRLPPGTYNLSLFLPQSSTERWIVTVSQPVTIQTLNLENREKGNSGT